MSVAIISDPFKGSIYREVVLKGVQPIMFDRYPGDNDTKLEWHQKIYLKPGTNQLILPAKNIISFLSSHNTNSAPKRLRDARKYKKICNAALSFCLVGPEYIPFLRDGKPITVGTFNDEKDAESGIYHHFSVPRLEKGVPNPNHRPVLDTPWELRFKLTLLKNNEIKEQEILNLFVEGGVAIGLGTYRGVFGKFTVAKWDELPTPADPIGFLHSQFA